MHFEAAFLKPTSNILCPNYSNSDSISSHKFTYSSGSCNTTLIIDKSKNIVQTAFITSQNLTPDLPISSSTPILSHPMAWGFRLRAFLSDSSALYTCWASRHSFLRDERFSWVCGVCTLSSACVHSRVVELSGFKDSLLGTWCLEGIATRHWACFSLPGSTIYGGAAMG